MDPYLFNNLLVNFFLFYYFFADNLHGTNKSCLFMPTLTYYYITKYTFPNFPCPKDLILTKLSFEIGAAC